jgi:hypothetical protein
LCPELTASYTLFDSKSLTRTEVSNGRLVDWREIDNQKMITSKNLDVFIKIVGASEEDPDSP